LSVERKRKIKAHASLMLVAVVHNLISFSAIMAPPWNNVGKCVSGGLSSVGMAHVAFGGLTMLASFWVLCTWLVPTQLLQSDKLRCYGKFNKRVMTVVTVLWVAAMIAVFIFFLKVNTTLLGRFPVGLGGGN
jgi:dipeptide/tripeptide permease